MQRNLIAAERGGTSRTGSEMLPQLEPGITLLRTPGPCSTVLHQLALQTIRQADGGAYWLDARNTASTYALHDFARDRRLLRRIHLARAFTAYQHVTLTERLVNTVSPRTGCMVLPNAPSLYRDDDVPEHEATPLFDAVVAALSEVATVYDLPVLVTDAGPIDDLAESVAVTAETRYRAESTDLGYRVVGEDFETTVYWDETGWQTTIPYWIDTVGHKYVETRNGNTPSSARSWPNRPPNGGLACVRQYDLCGMVETTVQAERLTPTTPATLGGV